MWHWELCAALTFVTGHERRCVNKRQRNLSFLFGRVEANAASVDLPHHRISLSHTFPVKSQEEHAAAEISTLRPSLFQIKTHWGSRNVSHTSVDGFFVFFSVFLSFFFFSAARLPSVSQNWGASVSLRTSPREGGREGGAAERDIDPLV